MVDQAYARSCSMFWDSSLLQDYAFHFHVQLEEQAIHRKSNSRQQNTSSGVLLTSSQSWVYYFFLSPASFRIFRLQILKGRNIKKLVYILYTLYNIIHNIVCIIMLLVLYFCIFILSVICSRSIFVY